MNLIKIKKFDFRNVIHVMLSLTRLLQKITDMYRKYDNSQRQFSI